MGLCIIGMASSMKGKKGNLARKQGVLSLWSARMTSNSLWMD
jgi:hypothetical protein